MKLQPWQERDGTGLLREFVESLVDAGLIEVDDNGENADVVTHLVSDGFTSRACRLLERLIESIEEWQATGSDDVAQARRTFVPCPNHRILRAPDAPCPACLIANYKSLDSPLDAA